MVDNPKYIARVGLLLSSPAGAGASVTYQTTALSTSMAGIDYDAVAPTPLPISEGATALSFPVVTRHPYAHDAATIGVALSDPVGCTLGQNQSYITLPGKSLHTLFEDNFNNAQNGDPLVGHVPDIGKVWEYRDEGNIDLSPAVITDDDVDFGLSDDDQTHDVSAMYAISATPGGGTYSASLWVSNVQFNQGVGEAVLEFGCWSESNSFDFGTFLLHFSNNKVMIGNNQENAEVDFDFSTLPSQFLVEMRWDMDDQRRTLYLNNVAVATIMGEPAQGEIDKLSIFTHGLTGLLVDHILVTQGGPEADTPATYYFEGSILSPSSAGDILISQPGAKPGVILETSVSGNTYDRTANVQLSLNLSSFNLDGVRVECVYRPQVGQRKYGPLAGGDETSETTRNQYGTIRASFGEGDEMSQQAPMNDILDLLYAGDAPLPLAPFNLVYEINGSFLRYSVNNSAFVNVPLDQTSTAKLNTLRLTAWVSAVRFENDGTYFEGPYALSEIVVKDVAPAEPALAWYGRSSFGSWSNWNAIDVSGTQDGQYPGASFAARILDNSLTGPVVWTDHWYPVEGPVMSRPMITFPKGPAPDDYGTGNVDWAKGVDVDPSSLQGEGYGEVALTATVDGVRIPGYLWMTWASGPQSYSSVAWGWSAGDPPAGGV